MKVGTARDHGDAFLVLDHAYLLESIFFLQYVNLSIF